MNKWDQSVKDVFKVVHEHRPAAADEFSAGR